MNCPVCNVALVMAERQGVEIDYCPKCRGVWFDRGELDKIIERSDSESVSQNRTYAPENRYERRHDDHHGEGHEGHGHHKRKNFLFDLFD